MANRLTGSRPGHEVQAERRFQRLLATSPCELENQNMPHAFKANPDHPAVAYLVRLHADLGGRILENRKEAKRLAESMKHVEAVIRLFDLAYDVPV